METLTNIERKRSISTIGWIGVTIMSVGMVVDVYSVRMLGGVLAAVGLAGMLYYYLANRR